MHHAIRYEPTPTRPKGWNLVARRQITAGNKVYPVGSVVPVEALGANLQAVLDARYAQWQPPTDQPTPPPRTVLTPPAAKPRPVVQVINDPDIVESWKRTKQAMIQACGGNVGLADDLLMLNRDARQLYQTAVRVACHREKQRRGGRVSITPDMVGL